MATYLSENWDGVAAGSRPSGLTNQSVANWLAQTTQFKTSPNGGGTNQADAVNAQGLMFSTIAPVADILQEYDVYLTTTQPPTYVITRSTSASSPFTSSYVLEWNDASGGATLKIYKASGGSIGSAIATRTFTSVSAAEWYRIGFQPQGTSTTTLKGYLYRYSTNQFLQSDGTWASTPAWALTFADSSSPITAAGYTGLSVYQGGTPRIYVDNLAQSDAVTTPSVPSGASTTISADNAAIHYPPGVVRIPGDGTAILMDQATSCRFSFTGSQLGVQIDTAALTASGQTAASWPNVYWEIDGGARQGPIQITAPATGTLQTIMFATALTTGGVIHYARIWYEEISGTDTWSHSLYATLSKIVVDLGTTLSAPAGPVADRSKKAMIFGDSITWGSVAGAVGSNPFYQGYTQFLADALGCDIGVVGKPAQGLIHNAGSLVVLGKDSWKSYDSTHARTQPQNLDYVFFAWGTNDASNDMTSQVTTTSGEARTAFGSQPWIIWIVPFNATHASEIAAGVAAAGIAKVLVISSGVTFPDTGNTLASSSDGTHPVASYHKILGFAVAASVKAAIPAGLRRNSANNMSGGF